MIWIAAMAAAITISIPFVVMAAIFWKIVVDERKHQAWRKSRGLK